MTYKIIMIKDEYNQNCHIEWGFAPNINYAHMLYDWCVNTNAHIGIYQNRKFIIEEAIE